MFDREHHERIRKIMKCLDRDLMNAAEAYFGGGTSIVLQIGEYRESVDIDFMCAVGQPGWRKLRTAFHERQFRGIFPDHAITEASEFFADQYGIHGWVSVDGKRDVKFEIVAEARVPLTGTMNTDLGVLELDHLGLFVQKLCANVDRSSDPTSMHRDILDILMMERHWGEIPKEAFEIAEGHYGPSIRSAYERSLEAVSRRTRLEECCGAMEITDAVRDEIISQLGDRYEDDFMDSLLPY